MLARLAVGLMLVFAMAASAVEADIPSFDDAIASMSSSGSIRFDFSGDEARSGQGSVLGHDFTMVHELVNPDQPFEMTIMPASMPGDKAVYAAWLLTDVICIKHGRRADWTWQSEVRVLPDRRVILVACDARQGQPSS